jgi:hypothetical protein
MAITLAADELSDAEITDRIALGDVRSAARLWVRFWPTALNAARELVEPADVPGLAAEALIGTIAVIAVGRGPREDVQTFLLEAVRELVDDDGLPPAPYPGTPAPDVSASPIMSRAFARLPDLVQNILWITVVGDRADELIAEALDVSTTEASDVRVEALTTLQRDYLAAHTDRVEDLACQRAHDALAGAAEDPGTAGLSRETWMHLSSCAWCTEAFHELAFSNAAIASLVDRAATAPRVVATTVVGPEIEVAEGGGLVEPEVVEPALVDLPADPLPRSGIHAAAASPSGSRRRRGRVMAGAALVAAVVVVVVVTMIVAGHGPDRSDPLEAAGPPTATPTQTAASVPGGTSPSLTPTSNPTVAAGHTAGTVVSDVPSPTITSRAPKPGTSASSSPTPTPTPQPSPTETPTPTPTPSPSPSPTPTRCNALGRLLGLC